MGVATTVAAARGQDSSATISISGAVDSTLTFEQMGFRMLTVTAALTANVNLFFPITNAVDTGAWWLVYNNTSGAFTLTVKNTTGTGVTIAQGKLALVRWDGTNMVAFPSDPAASGFAKSGANTDLTAITGILSGITAQGGLNISGSVGGNSAVPAPFTFGRAAIAYGSDADLTPSAAQYANPNLDLTSGVSLTATRKLILPLSAGAVWNIFNNTTGGQLINVIGASGTGVLVAPGRHATVVCDGVSIFPADNDNVDLTIGGGTTITKLVVYQPSLSPSSVGANTTAEQTFTVNGLLLASDTILTVSKPTAQAGLAIGGWRVSADNTLAITFVNDTASPITPTATQTYRVVAIRS
jgi:hypothetical protein